MCVCRQPSDGDPDVVYNKTRGETFMMRYFPELYFEIKIDIERKMRYIYIYIHTYTTHSSKNKNQ